MKVLGKFQPTRRIKCFSARARRSRACNSMWTTTLIPVDANCSGRVPLLGLNFFPFPATWGRKDRVRARRQKSEIDRSSRARFLLYHAGTMINLTTSYKPGPLKRGERLFDFVRGVQSRACTRSIIPWAFPLFRVYHSPVNWWHRLAKRWQARTDHKIIFRFSVAVLPAPGS